MTDPKLRAIEMFSGAGGSSALLGDSVEVVAAFDFWGPAQKVYQANNPDIDIFTGDITKYSSEYLSSKFSDIDLIIASPDCTSHSIAKGSAKGSAKSRNTAFQVVRFARLLRPRWVVLENVAQISNWDRYDELISEFESLDYVVSDGNILNATSFGVPQSRIRRFIICSLRGLNVQIKKNPGSIVSAKQVIEQNGKYPFSKLEKDGRASATLAKANSARQALGDEVPFLIVYYGSGKDGNGGWQSVDDPLRTITTLDRFAYIRPAKNGHRMRMLQPEELKQAMGFPKSYKLDEVEGLTRRQRVKLMGNAVCPPVMKAIVDAILAAEKSDNINVKVNKENWRG